MAQPSESIVKITLLTSSQVNGGEVLPLEKNADVKIVDHARKEAPPGSYVGNSNCLYTGRTLTIAHTDILIPSLRSQFVMVFWRILTITEWDHLKEILGALGLLYNLRKGRAINTRKPMTIYFGTGSMKTLKKVVVQMATRFTSSLRKR